MENVRRNVFNGKLRFSRKAILIRERSAILRESKVWNKISLFDASFSRESTSDTLRERASLIMRDRTNSDRDRTSFANNISRVPYVIVATDRWKPVSTRIASVRLHANGKVNSCLYRDPFNRVTVKRTRTRRTVEVDSLETESPTKGFNSVFFYIHLRDSFENSRLLFTVLGRRFRRNKM